MSESKEFGIPPALAAIAGGRSHIKTKEYARAMSRATNTIRKKHAESGQCFGIRPVKVGNFLLWPVSDIAALLNGSAK